MCCSLVQRLRELGREGRQLAILGQGNASASLDDAPSSSKRPAISAHKKTCGG